jgi:hypothetical protein
MLMHCLLLMQLSYEVTQGLCHFGATGPWPGLAVRRGIMRSVGMTAI